MRDHTRDIIPKTRTPLTSAHNIRMVQKLHCTDIMSVIPVEENDMDFYSTTLALKLMEVQHESQRSVTVEQLSVWSS